MKSSRNLIIGFGTNLANQDLNRFASSARKHISAEFTDIAIYTNNIDPATAKLASRLQVQLVPVKSIWKDVTQCSATRIEYQLLLYISEAVACLSFRKKWQCTARLVQECITLPWLHPFSARWIHYLDFINTNNHYGRVMCTDIRDVVFQKDPFQAFGSDDLCFFLTPHLKYGEKNLDTEWITSMYGHRVLDSVAGKSPICAGTVMGGAEPIKAFLELFKLHLIKNKRRPLDQAILNYVIQSACEHRQCKLLSNEDGLVYTNSFPEAAIWEFRDEKAFIGGVEFPVIHQFDRSTELRIFFDNLYVPNGQGKS